MDIRITPFSTLRSQSKTSIADNRNRFTSLNKLNRDISHHDIFHRDKTRIDKSKYAIPSIQAKKLRSTSSNNLLLLSKKNISKPRFSTKITSNIIQPPAVNVRITPFSNLATLTKTSAKTSPVYNRNRFTSFNKLHPDISHYDILHRDKTRIDKSKHTILSIPAKKLRSTSSNSLLFLSKKNISKPRFSIKITSNMIQPSSIARPSSVADKKGVLLYQQIEGNKLFSNRPELINRFHFNV